MLRRNFLRLLGLGSLAPATAIASIAAPDKADIDPALKGILNKVHADHKYKMTPEEFQVVLSYTSTSAFVASHLLARTTAYIELANGERATFPKWCVTGLSSAISKMLQPWHDDQKDGHTYGLGRVD